jgi:putative phosphoribosyl transferase
MPAERTRSSVRWAVREDMFADRRQAGAQLATRLRRILNGKRDVLVLAAPHGGLAVAKPIADALGAELDVLMVRKLRVPQHPDLVMGAVALGGLRIENDDLVTICGVDPELLDALARLAYAELRRQALRLRGTLQPADVEGRTVVLVDDGLSSGALMSAAIEAQRTAGARCVVVATPVASVQAAADLDEVADYWVCTHTPRVFGAVARWYRDFPHIGEAEARTLLGRRTIPPAPQITA